MCHICLMASPAGKCQLPLKLCPYPWNGPLATVSPLDGYKLQDVLARNWMSDFIATSIPFPPAENDKQECVLLLLDTWTWERKSKALQPVWGQTENEQLRQPTNAIQQDRNQGQNNEGFPQPKGQKMPMRHVSAARLVATAPLKALQAALVLIHTKRMRMFLLEQNGHTSCSSTRTKPQALTIAFSKELRTTNRQSKNLSKKN